jgi:hypothetical protein
MAMRKRPSPTMMMLLRLAATETLSVGVADGRALRGLEQRGWVKTSAGRVYITLAGARALMNATK